jgi:hypothetical protein
MNGMISSITKNVVFFSLQIRIPSIKVWSIITHWNYIINSQGKESRCLNYRYRGFLATPGGT